MTPKLTKYILHTPTVKQQAFLLLSCLDAFYGGAAGGGKSDALLMAALQYVDIPGYNALLIRDTYQNLTKPEGLLDRSNEWLMGTDAHWNEKQKAWIFPTGSTVSFGYLDSPRDHFNYQSAEYQFIGIDEAVNIRENQATYMFSRLRKKTPESYLNDLKQLHPDIAESILITYYEIYKNVPLRFRCASNPPTIEQYARGEWVKTKYVNLETKEKDAIFISARIDDNPHLNKKEYTKSLNKLDPITRAQLLDGDWDISVKGRFFKREWFKIVDVLPPKDEILQTVRRWDLAATISNDSNKEPAWTVGVRMHETKFDGWIIDSVVRLRETPLKIQKIIRQTADMDGKNVLVSMEQEPGSAGVSVIDTYRVQILPGFAFYEDKKQISKISSAMAYASQVEAGNIKLLNGYWNKEFLEEHEVFPDGLFKDQVDASCGAYNFLCEGVIPRATWA